MGQITYPSPIGYDAVDLSWMIGRSLAEVRFIEPASWRFLFGTQVHFDVWCLWRIVKHGHVTLTNEDHGQLFGRSTPIDAGRQAAASLAGVTITAVQLRRATADILIEFVGDLRLEVIPTSSGHESWQVCAPGGTCFVAQGGGQICTWTQ
jgi:hypothetical protein